MSLKDVFEDVQWVPDSSLPSVPAPFIASCISSTWTKSMGPSPIRECSSLLGLSQFSNAAEMRLTYLSFSTLPEGTIA